MPPSSPPRHPCEEEDPEPYNLIVIVSSGKIQLQHKASCYRGHGYSNRLIFPTGVHWRDSTTLGSPGWREPCQGTLHQRYPTQSSPSFGNQQRGHPPDYILCTPGFGT